MKSLRTVRYSLLAAAVAGGAMFSAPALAGVSATAGVANLYLWRGLNLGGGAPVVMGSLDYGHDSGLFAGVWGSSAGPDQEVDLYAGYAYSSDAFGFKVTAYDYSYPRSDATYLVEDPANPGMVVEESSRVGGELQEVVISANASGFFIDAILPLGDLEDYYYVDAGYTVGKVTGKVGFSDSEADDADYTHVDLTYAYNERLAFTVSGIADAGELSAPYNVDDALFVVSYTLPLELK